MAARGITASDSEWCGRVLRMGNDRVAVLTHVVIGQWTLSHSVRIVHFWIEARVSISFHLGAVTKLVIEHG